MTLTNHAYLEIEGTSTTATFELSIGLEHESQLTKSYLMGERGQYIREIVNATPASGDFDASRRTGYWIDGGAGDWQMTLSFRTGKEDVRWGDGDGGTGQANVTQTDGSGSGVSAISRKQILQYWLAKSKSDSGGTVRVHVGEWTDGSISGVSSGGISAGAFGEPMPVAIRESQFRGPQPEQGEVASFEGSITMSHVALWGGYDAPDWADSAVDAALDAADYIPDV